MHSSRAASRDLSRRQAAFILSIIGLVAVLIRIQLLRLVPGPSIFSDEISYIDLARSLALGQVPNSLGVIISFPNLLYSLLLASFNLFEHFMRSYAAIRYLNCFLMVATLWPAYRLTREAGGSRRAGVIVAFLAAILPMGVYSCTVMTENLFLPVTTLALWLTFRAALHPSFRRSLLAGLACGLAFHIKPHAVLLPPIALGTVALGELAGLAGRERRRGWSLVRGWLAALGRQWPMAVGWLLMIALRIPEVIFIERVPFHSPMQVLGMYSGVALGPKVAVTRLALALSLLGYLLVWCFTSGFLPALNLARRLPEAARGRLSRPLIMLTVMAALATLSSALMSARHTLLMDDCWMVHERYYGIFIIPAMALFALTYTPRRRQGGWPALLTALAVGLSLAAAAYEVHIVGASSMSTAPSLTGLALLTVRDFYKPLWPAGYMLLAGLGGVWAVLAAQGAARAWVAVALLYVAANFGYYTIQHQYNDKIIRPDRKMAVKIHKQLQPRDKLYVLTDDLSNSTKFQAAFYNKSHYVFKDPAFQIWPASPLPLAPDGTIAPEAPAGTNAYLLASKRFCFDQPAVKKFSTCALYQLTGLQTPLKLVGKLDPAALIARMDLRLKADQVPTVMRPGKKVTVEVEVLNQSTDPLAARLYGVGIGYHWGNFDPAAGGQGGVWDDGRFVDIPAGLAQGASARLSLSIRVPPQPGERWFLTLAPLVDVDGRHWDVRPEHALVIPVAIRPRSGISQK